MILKSILFSLSGAVLIVSPGLSSTPKLTPLHEEQPLAEAEPELPPGSMYVGQTDQARMADCLLKGHEKLTGGMKDAVERMGAYFQSSPIRFIKTENDSVWYYVRVGGNELFGVKRDTKEGFSYELESKRLYLASPALSQRMVGCTAADMGLFQLNK